jgi:hypothetical protein
MNFGSSHFGSGFFGSSERQSSTTTSTFDLVSATSNNAEFVDLVFNAILNTGNSALTNPISYIINNGDISVSFITVLTPYSIRVHVYEPIRPNILYTIRVDDTVTGLNGEVLNTDTKTFKWIVAIQKARRVNAAQYFNPGFGIIAEGYDDI